MILGATGPVDLGKMLIAAGWSSTAPFAITAIGTTTDQYTMTGPPAPWCRPSTGRRA